MRRNTSPSAAVLAAALAFTAACSNTDDFGAGSDPDPAGQEASGAPTAAPANDTTPEPTSTSDDTTAGADEELAGQEGGEDADYRMIVEFDEPFVHEDGGVRLSITGLGITDATSEELPSDVAEFLDDDVNTVLVLEMTASNDSGQQINFYPDQGTIQLLREQVEADLFFSDSVAGADWRDGVDSSGQVFWMLTTPFEEVVAAGELVYVASAPHDSETWEDVAGEFEVTVTW